jgi:hypothetical protein
MIVLPWIAFGVAVLLIIHQGTRAKADYERQQLHEKNLQKSKEALAREYMQGQPEPKQGDLSDMSGILGRIQSQKGKPN